MDGSLWHLMFIATIDSVVSVKSFLTQTTMSIDAKMPHDFNFTLLCSNGFLSLSKYGIYKKNEVRTIFVCLSVQLFDPVSSKICFWFGIIGFCCHGDHRSYNCSNLLVLTWDIWLLVFTPGLGIPNGCLDAYEVKVSIDIFKYQEKVKLISQFQMFKNFHWLIRVCIH